MLRWTCGVTKLAKIRNERIRGVVKVTDISKKVNERRLQWYDHVMRKDEEYVGRRMMGLEVQGMRSRGRARRRWMDSVREHLRERGLMGEEAQEFCQEC